MTPPFDPNVLSRSKAFDFVSEDVRRRIQTCQHWPDAPMLSDWAQQAAGHAAFVPRFTTARVQRASVPLDYERRVAGGQIPTREQCWHDLMNALVWMHFPDSKRVLNLLQLDETEARDPRNGRSFRQNVGAHFDECGAIVLCDEPDLLRQIRTLCWAELFWQRREELHAHLRLVVFGHGLLDQLRCPRVGPVAKAILLPCSARVLELSLPDFLRHADHATATALSVGNPLVAELFPMPVLGMPGWAPGQNPQFYANTGYFRTRRLTFQ